MSPRSLAALLALSVAVACGSSSTSGGGSPDGSTGDGGGLDGPGGSADGPGGGDDGASPTGDGAGGKEGGPRGDSGAPASTCTLPIQPVDTSSPTTVVGTGTAASCTEAALDAAVAKAGIVTFDCGGAATITLTHQIAVSTTTATTVDGGGKVTIDGGGATRLFYFYSGNYRVTTTVFSLQHLTLAHAKSSGTAIVAPAGCSQGTEIDGGGAAVFVRDGVLHVIDVTFDSNTAAQLGPDVGGAGIYAEGSLGITVVGSTFTGGSASNAGGIGCLNSDLTLANDVFTGNKATGTGGNTINTTMCPTDGGSNNGGEVGNGGDGAAVCIDGGSDGTVTICGCVFEDNSAGALGGALFRTPDGAPQTMNISQSTFDGNSGTTGAGAMYIHNSTLNISASTLSNNGAPTGGAVQSDGTTIDFVNDTFAGNTASKGLGGALALFGNGGTIQSCTFANDTSPAGSGYFAGAIAGGTTLTINDTIFDGDTSMDCGAPMACQDGSSAGEADLQWPQDHVVCSNADTPCAGGGATTFADAKLGALGQNGGPTETMVPMTGSPAIGAGKNCPATDQRGTARSANGCTIGAVEAK